MVGSSWGDGDRGRWSTAKRWWEQLPALWKLAVWLSLLAAVTMLFVSVPFLFNLVAPKAADFLRWFDRQPDAVRTAIGIFLILGFALPWVLWMGRDTRARELQMDVTGLRQRCSELTAEIDRMEAERERVLAVDEHLWTDSPPRTQVLFRELQDRGTPIVSMINLKGGVGKTTLTANVAAYLSSTHGLRILLVDLDFQGTLSEMSVDRNQLQLLQNQRGTVERLLTHESSEGAARQCLLLSQPMVGFEHVRVISSDDKLHGTDLLLTAKFLNGEETRFTLRSVFHKHKAGSDFDLIFFDCPPRITASAINALACSDFVVIPTKLSKESIDAIPRTIQWLERGRAISPAKPLCIVPNETHWFGGQLIRAELNALENLRGYLEKHAWSYGLILEESVRYSSEIANHPKHAVAASSEKVRRLFEPVSEKIWGRIRRCLPGN